MQVEFKVLLYVRSYVYFSMGHVFTAFKGSLCSQNDLGLCCSLVLVKNIGMCDLVIFHLIATGVFNTFSHITTSYRK